MGLDVIERLSRKYGSDSNFVLAGGGNTSFKDEDYLYVKGSGTELATITMDDFVKMSRESLKNVWTKQYSLESDKREAEVLNDLMLSKCANEEEKRPSVETLLHDLFSQSYVLHLHPTIVNGVTCSQKGESFIKKTFPNAIWVEETEPGYVLATKCRNIINEYEKSTNNKVNVMFLQNHGVFFGADDEDEMDELVMSVMSIINKKIKKSPDFKVCKFDEAKANKVKKAFEIACKDSFVNFTFNKEIKSLCGSLKTFSVIENPFTPDQIVYCKSKPMFAETINCEFCAMKAIKDYVSNNGFSPKVVFVKDVGMLAIGNTEKEAQTITDIFLDAIKIYRYSQNFGGARYMSEELVDFIANWEVEKYRSKISLEEK